MNIELRLEIKPELSSESKFEMTIMKAHLFDTEIGRRLYAALPVEVELQTWGDESYGSIGIDLGEENPIAMIPPGGIAYTNQGDYLCLFYGQCPAWPVEHVGEILDEQWKKLRTQQAHRVRIIVANK
ncbi:MAG: cyclophilin-like fold protein [Gammaproteobacteria bacterium]|nr:cyclophilin-like fold protein [Gammaproteobacteria bacterium]